MSSKHHIFLRRLFLNLIATKDQLSKRGISFGGNDHLCVLCRSFEESSFHLFLSCVFAGNVGKGIERWLGIELVLDSNSIDSYVDFGRSLRKEVDNKLGNVIWAASVWQIWVSRNNLMFRGKAFSVEYIVLSSFARGVGCV